MQLIVEPRTALVDERVVIRLTGFVPGQLVTVRAKMSEIPGAIYEAEAYASFRADLNGEVQLDRDAPLSGTYSGVDAMGLFWSMQASHVRYNGTRKLNELHFTPGSVEIVLTAEIEGETRVQDILHRRHISSDVASLDVTDNGLVGKYFYPQQRGTGAAPGIIVLGGGEGGLGSQLQYAALFASHGFPALALAYFRFEHLPEHLREIPLEYFSSAIHWLQAREEVAPDRLGLFGRSKGAELALLLGSTYPEIKAVIASSPSSTVCIGNFELGADDEYRTYSSWSYRGSPVRYVNWTTEQCAEADACLNNGRRIDSIHRAAWEQCDIVEEATIRVENISGPIMIITSSDDHWWPAELYGEHITERLRANHFSHRIEHLHYQDTGHMIRYPYVPTTQLTMNGGTAANNAHASEDSWRRVIRFLEQSFTI